MGFPSFTPRYQLSYLRHLSAFGLSCYYLNCRPAGTKLAKARGAIYNVQCTMYNVQLGDASRLMDAQAQPSLLFGLTPQERRNNGNVPEARDTPASRKSGSPKRKIVSFWGEKFGAPAKLRSHFVGQKETRYKAIQFTMYDQYSIRQSLFSVIRFILFSIHFIDSGGI